MIFSRCVVFTVQLFEISSPLLTEQLTRQWSRPASLLLAALVTTSLSDCVATPDSSYPIAQSVTSGAPAEHIVLLPAAEITAVLDVEVSGQRSSYLLALRSESGHVDLALLTPQGGPLYQLRSAQGEQTLTRKLADGKEPSGQDLLIQMQLIYGAEIGLRLALGKGWTLQQDVNGRTFVHPESARKIVINYAGDPPWFPQAQLIDSLDDTILTVWIQEQRDVLPE